ncbi:MAG: serine/threonine protein kinase [Massilia sp.]|nr:serine/threonine protein kinase [Massilia sp.]
MQDTIITLQAGRYRLVQQLAGSAYGIIWRAESEHGAVALKLINREQMALARPELRERWIASAEREIAFLRSLAPWDGRHIVRLIDSGEHAGLPVIALEMLDQDLGKVVASRRAIDLPTALDWLAQLNQALAKVHQYGWRYLDLKPSNVLFDQRRGYVKLADFGTNRRLDDEAPHDYGGTASWQAPEQFFPDGDSYRTDARSDYFSLGALFYYLIMGGKVLRFCQACGDAYRAHRQDGADRLRAHGVPPTLADDEAALFATAAGPQALAMLRRLLASDPRQRPAHALSISRMIADASQLARAA